MTELKANLFEKFRDKDIRKGRAGTELYLSIHDAMEFIIEAGRMGLAIGRVEGFGYVDGKIYQRLDLIWDFDFADESWTAYRDNCNRAARELIARLAEARESIILTFVVESQDDWQKGRQC